MKYTIGQAVGERILELLEAKKMTQYRLGVESGLTHPAIGRIINEKNKTVNFKTVAMIANGFGMTLMEFLDAPYFDFKNLDIE